MVRIAGIEVGSIAEELELEIGTRIVRVNGQRVRDGIDLSAEPEERPEGGELAPENHRDHFPASLAVAPRCQTR